MVTSFMDDPISSFHWLDYLATLQPPGTTTHTYPILLHDTGTFRFLDGIVKGFTEGSYSVFP